MSSAKATLIMTDEDLSDVNRFECPICFKQYAIRSSCVRHSRKCLEQRVSSSKQKSCRQCSTSKLRCDKAHPTCSRCTTRNATCEYVTSKQSRSIQQRAQKASDRESVSSSSLADDCTDLGSITLNCSTTFLDGGYLNTLSSPQPNNNSLAPVSNSGPGYRPEGESAHVWQQPSQPGGETIRGVRVSPEGHNGPTVNFGNDTAIRECEVRLQPNTDQSPDSTKCASFVTRILRTYPRMMSGREQLPPFIHESQVSSASITTPLQNCFALSRMWESGSRGISGTDIVESSIRREMDSLLGEYRSYDDATLVAAFQSTIIYAIILLFPDPRKPPSRMFDLTTLASLRELGLYIAEGSLILAEERSHTRPSWHEWVLMNCKRRTLTCLNLFTWINAIHSGFSNFPCAEADFVPAPASKVLWSLNRKDEWEIAYDRWLGRWAGLGIYTLEVLQKVRGPDLDLRSEMWVEEADEFGIMMMALRKHPL